MLKRILDALSALLRDTPVLNRLLDQLKTWGESQEQARNHLIAVLTNVVQSFERSHAIVMIELSRLTTAASPEQYRQSFERIDHNKFYDLFKTNEVCVHLHELRADLESGFGTISDSIVLGAAKQLKRALGEFEHYEYSLAEGYIQYLRSVLYSPSRINTQADLKDAIAAIVDQEKTLAEELNELTTFKRQILHLTLY